VIHRLFDFGFPEFGKRLQGAKEGRLEMVAHPHLQIFQILLERPARLKDPSLFLLYLLQNLYQLFLLVGSQSLLISRRRSNSSQKERFVFL
jgi:hypothetical protein